MQDKQNDHKIVIHIDGNQHIVTDEVMSGAALRGLADIPSDSDLWQKVPGQDEDISISDEMQVQLKPGMHFATKPGVIHYTVDDEPQVTQKREMTVRQIMEKAFEGTGKVVAEYYLKDITDINNQVSYEGRLDAVVQMHEGQKFLAIFNGATSVS